MTILFIVGQTAVGKSTSLEALFAKQSSLLLLPNRRVLTDAMIIPEMLKDSGKQGPVTDRLERFTLTAAYRQKYASGIIHALKSYLAKTSLPTEVDVVFDNIRGLTECQAALEAFPQARFVFLFAPAMVRLKRLLGRKDAFDTTPIELTSLSLRENLAAIPGLDEVFEVAELLALQKQLKLSSEELLAAVQILLTEQQHYQAEAAAHYLKARLSEKQLLYLDTSLLGLADVSQKIGDWL